MVKCPHRCQNIEQWISSTTMGMKLNKLLFYRPWDTGSKRIGKRKNTSRRL